MIVVAGEIKCDVPECGVVAKCILELNYRNESGLEGLFGIGAAPTIKKVLIPEATEPWHSFGFSGGQVACPKHSLDDLAALEAAQKAASDAAAAERKREYEAKEVQRKRWTANHDCPHCGYPTEQNMKGIYTEGKPCDGCGWQQQGFFMQPPKKEKT